MSLQVERNQEATVYIGNLDERVTVPLLWELMVQAGPVVNVHIPKDRVTQMMQGYGFCEFQTEEDASYAVNTMNMALADKKPVDTGANIFISNLDPSVDEKMLYDTFSSFGPIVLTPRIAYDPDTGNSRGFAFISFGNFEASDAAIEAMDGQYLANKKISVNYALKKDGKGERYGSAAERLLAAQAKKNKDPNELNPVLQTQAAYPPNFSYPYPPNQGFTGSQPAYQAPTGFENPQAVQNPYSNPYQSSQSGVPYMGPPQGHPY
ncbi:hypothetical protein BB560_005954 [Smittium megazygosporum]|uniref:Splicing factor 3B subunit 4 n=1 Tax=Smittium megazygosporum TaxID=133381 RepID=A0A2T9YPF1_9FUNG|nr:hypothetical protein BB560_005954 [Smittium megazygosporum]